MNKRQQRKLAKLMVKHVDHMEVLFRIYGKARLEKAFREQCAWVLYYLFKREDEPDNLPAGMFVKQAVAIVRNRRSCFKEFGRARAYITLKKHNSDED